MRNKLKFLLLTAILIFVILLSSCKDNSSDNSNPSDGDTIEVNFNDRTFAYDGNTHVIEIDESLPDGLSVRYEYYLNGELISSDGVVEPGEYIVVVIFEGNYSEYGLPSKMEASLIIEGEGKPFEVWFKDQTFAYDGSYHSIYISGYIPFDIKVCYEYFLNGEEFVHHNGVCEPGNYRVIAKFEGPVEKYGLPDMLEAWLTIEGQVEAIDIKFEDLIYCYDEIGDYLTLEIDGVLPGDVWVEYENNRPTEFGEHTARAYFRGEYTKYGLPEVMEATIIIFEEIEFFDQVFLYDGMYHNMTIHSYIPSDVWIEYENNNYKSPGRYLVTARICGEYEKYGFQDKYHAYMTIFDSTQIRFETKEFEYTGDIYSLIIEGLPEEIDVYYEFYLDEEYISDYGVSEIGEYKVLAYLQGNYEKYNLPAMYEAVLKINGQLECNVTYENKEITYDGNFHFLQIEGDLPEGVEVSYSGNDALNVGVYYYTATFSGKYELYGLPDSITAELKIMPYEITEHDVSFISETFEYDCNYHSLSISSDYSRYLVVSYVNNEQSEIGLYEVSATISSRTNPNTDTCGNYVYVGPTTLTATLTIKKPIYHFNNNEEVIYSCEYTGEYIEMTHNVYLPNELKIAYYENNRQIELGEYEAYLVVTFKDEYLDDYEFDNGTSYYKIPFTFIITPKYVCPEWNGLNVTYDGNTHVTEINPASIPFDSWSVTYENNEQIYPGKYVVKAEITYTPSEYYIMENSTITAEFNINKASFEGCDYTVSDTYFRYSGNPNYITVSNLPVGTEVTYEGNGMVNAGEYTVTVTLAHQYYETYTFDVNYTIGASDLDIDSMNLSFYSDFEYDGTTHKVSLVDNPAVPSYLEFTYSQEEFVDAGTYDIVIYIEDRNGNYHGSQMELTVIVEYAKFDIDHLEFKDATYTYTGDSYSLEVLGDVPSGLSYYYEGNNQTEAGNYEVKLIFTCDNKNYELPQPMVANLIINKATLDISNISFEDFTVTYDGQVHGIYLTGDVPSYFEVTYENNDQTEVGTYEVVAKIFHSLSNYEQISDLTATLKIEEKEIEVSFVDQAFDYNGQPHSIYLKEVNEDMEVVYEGNEQVLAGAYTVVANISSKSGNYKYPAKLEATLIINSIKLDVQYNDGYYEYDGNEKVHLVAAKLPDDVTAVYTNNTNTRAGVYTSTVSFSQTNNNYILPGELTAIITIEKVDYFDVTVDIEGEISYIYAVKRGEYLSSILPKIPEKAEHTSTWDYTENTVTSDITVKAIYTRIEYDIFLNTDGATLNIPHISVAYGFEFILPEINREGFTFLGWYYQNELIESGIYQYKEDIEIMARWEADVYELSLCTIDGHPIDHFEVQYRQLVQLPLSFYIDEELCYSIKWTYNGKVYQGTDVKVIYDTLGDDTIVAELYDMDLNNSFTYQYNSEYYYDLGKLEWLTITSYSGEHEEIIIPEYGCYEGKIYPIQKINSSIGSEYTKKLVIPKTITYYNLGLLKNCTNLESLTISYMQSSLNYLFNSSVPITLETVEILQAVDGYNSIPSFSGNTSIKKVIIPEGYTELTNYAFRYCSNLEEVVLPSTLKTIGYCAFEDCTSLKTITIPDNVKKIERSAFEGCTLLESVSIGENSTLSTVGSYTFSDCISLKSITLPANITTISGGLFSGCTSLSSVVMSTNITSIESEAFRYCTQLTSINLGNRLESIGHRAFSHTSISSVTFPNTLKTIGDGAFGYLTLTSVIIPASVESIGSSAFVDNKQLTTLTLSDGLNSIGERAFSGCKVLNNITLPDTLIKIGKYAFSSCKALTSIAIPNSITRIENNTFSSCELLAKVTLPNNLVYIGDDAFEYTAIASITLPDTVEYIGSGSFNYTRLTSITIPAKVTEISQFAFSNSDLTSVVFNGKVEKIDLAAFASNPIKTINLPSSLTYIGPGAFEYTFLETITLPSKLEYIGYNAFSNCYFTEVLIPDSVSYIGASAFYSDKLTKITIPYVGTIFENNDLVTVSSIYGTAISTMHIKGGYVYSESLKDLTALKTLTISNDVMFVESNFNQYSTELVYNVYQNGNYVGNDVNKYLVFAGIIDENTTLTLHENTVFGMDTYENILTLENGIYYFPTATNPYYMAVGFENPASVTEVILNENTEYLGEGLFYECSLLSKVVLPSSLKKINKGLFANNSTLSILTLPYLGTTPDCAIPLNVDDLFDENNLVELTISGGVIGDYGLVHSNHYTNKYEKIIIGKNVTSLGEYIFSGLTSLNTVMFEEGNTNIKTINSNTFQMSENYSSYSAANISTIVLPNHLEVIEDYAFAGLSYLTSITIPASVKEVGNYTFAYSNSLVEVVFEEGSKLERIGAYAFAGSERTYNDSVLETIELPNTVKEIGDYAFYRCEGITKFTLPSSVETLGEGVFMFAGISEGFVFAEGTKITTIPKQMFEGSKIKSIEIPSTVTKIESRAFYSCNYLTSFLLNEGLEEIDDYAFWNVSFTSLDLPSTIKHLGIYAFSFDYQSSNGGNYVDEIVVPNGIETYDLSSIDVPVKKLVIGENVKTVTYSDAKNGYGHLFVKDELHIYSQTTGLDKLFRKYLNHDNSYLISSVAVYYYGLVNEWLLLDIDLSCYYSSVTFINELGETYQPTEVVVPSGAKSIHRYTFANNTNLTSITFNEGLENIGRYAFSGCVNLGDVVFPDSILSIGERAFENCRGLKEITLPANAKPESYAFVGCSSIKRVAFEEGIEEIDNRVFSSSAFSLLYVEEVYLPSTVKKINDMGIYVTKALYYNGTLSDWLNIDCNNYMMLDFSNNSYVYFINSDGEYELLEEIVIEHGVTEINKYQLCNFPNIEKIVIPNTIKSLGENWLGYRNDDKHSLYYSGSLEEWMNIDFGKNANPLHDSSAYSDGYCENYLMDDGIYVKFPKDIIVPSRITELKGSVFTNLNLNSITIHENVTKIDNSMFGTVLENIYYEGSISDWCKIDIIYEAVYDAHFYLKNEEGIYKEVKAISVPDDIIKINDYQFSGLSYIEKIYLHDNVIEIGTSSLYHLNLTKIRLSKNLSSIYSSFRSSVSIIASTNISYIYSITNCTLFYEGSYEMFSEKVEVSNNYKSTIHYYSESEPTDTIYTYWHYDEYNNPVLW